MAENIRSSKISFSAVAIGVMIVLLFCGLGIFLILQRQAIPTYDDVRKEARLKNLAELNAANEKALTGYRWIDKAKGIVGLPIDRAMDLVLADLQTNKPHPAGSITTNAAPAKPASEGQPAAKPEGQSSSVTPAGGSQPVTPTNR